ncbi:MAG: hypothetical protein P8Y70_07615 [Candidatus Lokiarchaeota archaeon]
MIKGKGTDINKPIIISGCNNSIGVDCEYKELKRRFGNYKLLKQVLINKNNKMYDKLEIFVNGKQEEVYFDITDFFGKF